VAEITYDRLEEILRSRGFSFLGIEKKNKVYKHEATGAYVIFPEFPGKDPVQQRHLSMVRGVLDAYGIADPLDFEKELLKAS